MTADKPPNTTRLCKLRNKASSSIASRIHSAKAATPLYDKKKKFEEITGTCIICTFSFSSLMNISVHTVDTNV
jgi:hypothetical protein